MSGGVLFVEMEAAAKPLCAKNEMVGDDEKKMVNGDRKRLGHVSLRLDKARKKANPNHF